MSSDFLWGVSAGLIVGEMLRRALVYVFDWLFAMPRGECADCWNERGRKT